MMAQMYGRVRRLDRVLDVLVDVNRKGFKRDERFYNAVLGACIHNGSRVRLAVDVLRDMYRDGLLPPNDFLSARLYKTVGVDAPEMLQWIGQRVPQTIRAHGKKLPVKVAPQLLARSDMLQGKIAGSLLSLPRNPLLMEGETKVRQLRPDAPPKQAKQPTPKKKEEPKQTRKQLRA